MKFERPILLLKLLQRSTKHKVLSSFCFCLLPTAYLLRLLLRG